MWDSIDDAICQVVHDFPGGAVKLAPRVNMNAGTLQNKANPGIETHQLSVKEAVAIQSATGDVRILQAEALTLGYCCIPLGDFTGTSDIELLNSYAAWHAEISEITQAVVNAIGDRCISRDEYERVRLELHQDAQRGFEFLSRLEALIDER